MNKRENETVKLFLFPLIIAAILFLSIAELPYGFYTFMRIVVPFLSVIYLFFAFMFTDGFNLMHIPNILIVILWNPIVPVYLDKETWVIIDVIFGICELGIAYYAYRLEIPVKQRQSTPSAMSYKNDGNAHLQYMDKYRKEIIERQIEQLESRIEEAKDIIKNPKRFKPESQSMGEFVANHQQYIEETKTKILRLKSGDIALSEELIKDERYCGTFLYYD